MPLDAAAANKIRQEMRGKFPPKITYFHDCSLLRVNKLLSEEAKLALVRTNPITITNSLINGGLFTTNAATKKRLTFVLQQAKQVGLTITHLNRYAWYLRILSARGDIDRLYLWLDDEETRLAKRWIQDEGQAKHELDAVAAIRVKSEVSIWYAPSVGRRFPTSAERRAFDAIRDWLEKSVASKMMDMDPKEKNS